MGELTQFDYLSELENALLRRFLMIVMFPFLLLDSIVWSIRFGYDLPTSLINFIWYGLINDVVVCWNGLEWAKNKWVEDYYSRENDEEIF